jgi:proteasome lid subunit RPN8/RPN11
MMSEEVRNTGILYSDDSSNGSQEGTGVVMSEELYSELLRICLEALPHKAYGLVGGSEIHRPESFYPCKTNLRNTPEWKSIFDSFGDFHRNPDLGFVIEPSEVKVVTDRMASRGESLVGVFHSHRYLRDEPSIADIALSSGSELLSYIVSVTDPRSPRVGVFALSNDGYQRIPIIRG